VRDAEADGGFVVLKQRDAVLPQIRQNGEHGALDNLATGLLRLDGRPVTSRAFTGRQAE
jgi:hypothetical protein